MRRAPCNCRRIPAHFDRAVSPEDSSALPFCARMAVVLSASWGISRSRWGSNVPVHPARFRFFGKNSVMKKAILYSALCLSGSALLATEGDGQAFTEEGPGFKEITIRIGGSRALTAALLDGAAKEKKVTGIADFDSFSAIYGLMGIYPKGTVPSSSLYGHRFRLRFPPDSDVAEITGPYRNLTYIAGRWGGVESKREVGNKPHVDKGRQLASSQKQRIRFRRKRGYWTIRESKNGLL